MPVAELQDGQATTDAAQAAGAQQSPQPSQQSTFIDVFNKDGNRGQIPVDQMDRAFSQGYRFAVQKGDAWTPVLPVQMTSPSGTPGWVPAHQAGAALKQGYTVGQPMTSIGDKVTTDDLTGQRKFTPANPQPSGIGEHGIDPAVFEGAKKIKEAVSSTGKVLKTGGGTLLKMVVNPTPTGIATALAEESAQQQRDGGIPNSKEVLLHPLRELAGERQPGESAMLSAYNNPDDRPSLAMRLSNFGSSLMGGDPESARQHYDAAQTAFQQGDHTTADRELQLAYADKYAVPVATLGLGKLGSLGKSPKLKTPVAPAEEAATATTATSSAAAAGAEVKPPAAPSAVGTTAANSPDIVAAAQEAAAQKLFGKPFSQLELSDKLKAIREATSQQTSSVDEVNAAYRQAKAEMGANADPVAIKARADQMLAARRASAATATPAATIQPPVAPSSDVTPADIAASPAAPETGPQTVPAGGGLLHLRPGQEVVSGVPIPRLVGEERPYSIPGRVQRASKSTGVSPKRFDEFQSQQAAAVKQVMQRVFDDLGGQPEGTTTTPGDSAARAASVFEDVNKSTTPFWRTYDTVLHDAAPDTAEQIGNIVQNAAKQAQRFGAENPEHTVTPPTGPRPVYGGPNNPEYRYTPPASAGPEYNPRSIDELARGETFWRVTREGKVLSNAGSSRPIGLGDGEALFAVDSKTGEVRMQTNRTGMSNELILRELGPDVQNAAAPHLQAAENEALWREAVRGQRIGDEAAAQLRRKMGLPAVPGDAPIEPNLQDYSRVRNELTAIRDRATDPKVVRRIDQALNRMDAEVAVALRSSGVRGAFDNFRTMMDSSHRAMAIRIVGTAIDDATHGTTINAGKLTESLAKLEQDGVLFRAFGSQEPIDSLRRVTSILAEAQRTKIGQGRTLAQYALEVGTAEAAGLVSGHAYLGVNYIVARALEVAGAKGLVRTMTNTKGLKAMNALTTASTPERAATAANSLLKMAGKPMEDFTPILQAVAKAASVTGPASGAERRMQPTPTVKPPVSSSSPAAPALPSLDGLTKQEKASRIMMMVKTGNLSPTDADSEIKRLVGSGGRKMIRMPVDSRLVPY